MVTPGYQHSFKLKHESALNPVILAPLPLPCLPLRNCCCCTGQAVQHAHMTHPSKALLATFLRQEFQRLLKHNHPQRTAHAWYRSAPLMLGASSMVLGLQQNPKDEGISSAQGSVASLAATTDIPAPGSLLN